MARPFATRAQQRERLRRIAVLIGYGETDRQGKAFIIAFLEGLLKLGWNEGGNVRVDIRWVPAGNADATQQFASELIALKPDLVVAHGTPATAVLQQQTGAIPIVFVAVSDPVGSGFVASFPRPGGNVVRQIICWP